MNINGDYKKITLAGAETEIKFPRNYPVFGVKGENITVALAAGAVSNTRSTADTDGVVMWAHKENIDTMYLTGTGDAIVWAGDRAEECPFSKGAKGGDETEIVSLTATENKTYTAPAGTAYSPVTVNVPANVGTKTITENGTYTASTDDLDGYSSVVVNTPVYAIVGLFIDEVIIGTLVPEEST